MTRKIESPETLAKTKPWIHAARTTRCHHIVNKFGWSRCGLWYPMPGTREYDVKNGCGWFVKVKKVIERLPRCQRCNVTHHSSLARGVAPTASQPSHLGGHTGKRESLLGCGA